MTEEEVLFANEAFYLAFTQKDPAAMATLWAIDHPVICVHPGRAAITSRHEIVTSWERILGNPDQVGIDFYNPQAHRMGDSVLVTCYEQIGGGVCTAANLFVSEAEQPRLVLHQSGQCMHPPDPLGSSQQSG